MKMHLPFAAAALAALSTVAYAQPSFTLARAMPVSMNAATLAHDGLAVTHAAGSGSSLVFRQHSIRLVAHTGPSNDMLSFRIDNRRNPTIVVPRGAVLRILFVNTDDDMDHDLRIGGYRSRFPGVVSRAGSTGSITLPPKAQSRMRGEELVLRTPGAPGRYSYFCSMRGHAQGGMWGTLLVR